MKPLSLICAAAVAGPLAAAADGPSVIFVDAATCPDMGNGTRRNPFCSIQDAIDAASSGGEVRVAAGVYEETIELWGKAITVRAVDGPDVTTIDALGTGTVVTCEGVGPDTVIDGFTITGGDGTTAGGMLNISSSPTVVECVFLQNTSNNAGAMGNYGASPTVVDCMFIDNEAPGPAGLGGAIYNTGFPEPAPVFMGCTFSGNRAGFGGAMNTDSLSTPVFIDCTFEGNVADDTGGAIRTSNSPSLFWNCLFKSNEAIDGAGIADLSESDTCLVRCRFEDNIGQGLFNGGSSPILVSSLFANNTGAGMASSGRSEPNVVNCTFVGNSIAIHSFPLIGVPHVSVANCILWENGPDQIVNEGQSSADVRFSDVQGGWPLGANIDADPLFVDAPGGDYRIGPGSPCIDRADNTAIPIRSADLAGGPRIRDDPKTRDNGVPFGHKPIVDMGAHEF
ncbi:MAG: right-handed parallel beta-helix repeat-containing protein [Planctomycetota bacterium]